MNDFKLPQFDTPVLRKILGIAAEVRLTDWYDVLGVPRFCADGKVLEAALRSRLEHARQFEIGSYLEPTQLVLEELAKAWIWLLDADRRARYDVWLRDTQRSAYGRGEVPDLSDHQDETGERERAARGGRLAVGTADPGPDSARPAQVPPRRPADPGDPERRPSPSRGSPLRAASPAAPPSRWPTLVAARRQRGYFLALGLAVPVLALLALLVLLATRPAAEPGHVPPEPAAVVLTEASPLARPRAGETRAASLGSFEPGLPESSDQRLNGFLVDLMCRPADVRLLICLETMGLDAHLVEAVADDPGFAAKILDYRTAFEAWGASAGAGETFDAGSFLLCQQGDRITFTGNPCEAAGGWASFRPCEKVLRLADIRRSDDASSLVSVGQPRSSAYDPAVLRERDTVTQLLRNPELRSTNVRVEACRVAGAGSPPGFAWIRVPGSFYARLLLDVRSLPNAATLTSQLSADSPASVNICFRGEFQDVVPVLHCVDFPFPEAAVGESVAAAPPPEAKARRRTTAGPEPERRRDSSSPSPFDIPSPKTAVEERWFKISSDIEDRRFYGTYAEARREAQRMRRELGVYVRISPE